MMSIIRGRDAVLHLAALIAIPYSYQAPQSYVDTNVTGTLNVLEAIRLDGNARLIQGANNIMADQILINTKTGLTQLLGRVKTVISPGSN